MTLVAKQIHFNYPKVLEYRMTQFLRGAFGFPAEADSLNPTDGWIARALLPR